MNVSELEQYWKQKWEWFYKCNYYHYTNCSVCKKRLYDELHQCQIKEEDK